MKANARSPRSLLLAAGVSLIAQSAFSQSPPAARRPRRQQRRRQNSRLPRWPMAFIRSAISFHRNVFLVTSDGVIATDPISPDAAAARVDGSLDPGAN
jgi:hypothetical protein